MPYHPIRSKNTGRLLGELDARRKLFRIKAKGKFYIVDLEEEERAQNGTGIAGETALLPPLPAEDGDN
jgi:hypothetical protein